jgi:hypothetical protein
MSILLKTVLDFKAVQLIPMWHEKNLPVYEAEARAYYAEYYPDSTLRIWFDDGLIE